LTAPEVLCAILLERKLKRAAIALSPDDRAGLKACTRKLMETGDASLLVEAVPQCQDVGITFGDEDVEEAQRIHDERRHALTTSMTAKLTKVMEKRCALGEGPSPVSPEHSAGF
jgi:hypothetical protein